MARCIDGANNAYATDIPGFEGEKGAGWMGLMIVSWSCDEARDVEYSKLYMNVCVGDMLFHRVPCGLVG